MCSWSSSDRLYILHSPCVCILQMVHSICLVYLHITFTHEKVKFSSSVTTEGRQCHLGTTSTSMMPRWCNVYKCVWQFTWIYNGTVKTMYVEKVRKLSLSSCNFVGQLLSCCWRNCKSKSRDAFINAWNMNCSSTGNCKTLPNCCRHSLVKYLWQVLKITDEELSMLWTHTTVICCTEHTNIAKDTHTHTRMCVQRPA